MQLQATAAAAHTRARLCVAARAAQRWFGMPKVVTGFLNFATQPAVAGLMLPGIQWLAEV